ncbi:MAG: enolase C-terminal domain-like protein [Chloroflexota bacterium]|nr:enolase C-terminal domain-like protein [Chloroflexota bacterium]
MKITDVQVIAFRVPVKGHGTKWGYGVFGKERPGVQRITKIATDVGAEGFAVGGEHGYFYAPTKNEVEHLVKPLLLGEEALDRERLWHMMMSHRGFSERLIGNIDCALWDLMGRIAGVPVAKLLGGAREKAKAYASTAPNLGPPEVYAQHALECKALGYKSYKVHAYIYWDPHKQEPAPRRPAFPKEDVAVCRAVREAVGDDIVLMLDPWGIYTYDEALYVGREIQKLNYYFFEHPMDENKLEPYRKLCEELDIPICGPELAPGSCYSRAEWVLQRASDIGRIDTNFGGITACRKAVDMYETMGLRCEMHVGGFGNAQILGATTEDTCEFFERGLLRPGEDYDVTPSYLNRPCDPMDDEGYVHLPQGHGLGVDFNWDYINDNLIQE